MNYFDEIFEGSPEKKFFEVLHTANKNVVNEVLKELFKEMLIIEAKESDKELDPYSSEMDERLNSLYMDLTLKIVRQCE